MVHLSALNVFLYAFNITISLAPRGIGYAEASDASYTEDPLCGFAEFAGVGFNR
jgi:hypothetical protein